LFEEQPKRLPSLAFTGAGSKSRFAFKEDAMPKVILTATWEVPGEAEAEALELILGSYLANGLLREDLDGYADSAYGSDLEIGDVVTGIDLTPADYEVKVTCE
jgi:hypothetical protein